MDMKYKPDWEETKERYKAWWAHEDFGRCAISVTAPKSGIDIRKAPTLPEKVKDRWLDFDYLHELNEYGMSSTFFGGEAVPRWSPGYPGWDSIPAYLGCEVELREETGWVAPIIEHSDFPSYDYSKMKISPDNKWWNFSEKMHRFAVQESKGKSIPGIQAIGGCGDTLASLRSTGELLFDVMDCPDYVRDFEIHLMKMWIEVFDKFYNITKDGAEGSSNWMGTSGGPYTGMWAPGKFYIPQNDFSYMISPKMYQEIFLPALELQLHHLDYSIYHVDGIGAFCHVDMLCDLPKLQCIQILPGAGKPSPLYYMDILKKVQASGKNLWIYIEPQEVKLALEELSSRGLYITTTCQSEEEAVQLIDNTKKWSKVR